MPAAGRGGAWILLTVLVHGSLCAQPAPPSREGSLEYRVKAGYLLNFARYVEWPAAAFASETEPLNVCVVGDDPFGTVLDRTLQGKVIGERAVVALRPPSLAEAEGCHILYLSAPEEDPRALGTWPGTALTVGESSGFLAAGGMVRFLIVEETVRFEVNLAAAQRAGLRISSRMLSFAWTVHPPS